MPLVWVDDKLIKLANVHFTWTMLDIEAGKVMICNDSSRSNTGDRPDKDPFAPWITHMDSCACVVDFGVLDFECLCFFE